MNRNHPNQLAAKIAAQNEANATANRIARELQPVLRAFVGRKIYNLADGSQFHQFKKALPAFTEKNPMEPSVWINENYGLKLRVKTCHQYPDRHGKFCFATYAEAIVYLGDVEVGILTRLNALETSLREDFTAEEVIAARKRLAEAKHAADVARNALYTFGEYDN